MIALRSNVVVPKPVEIDVDVEHCLWAASSGLQPIDVIAAVGIRWPALALPTWEDALLAIRVAAARLRPALRVVAGTRHRRAA